MHVSKTFRNRRWSTTIWIEAFRTINLWSAIWKTNAFYLFIDLAQNSLNLIFKWKQKNPVILCIYCSYWIMIIQINLPSLTPRVLHCLISLPQPRIHTHSGCTHVLPSWCTPIYNVEWSNWRTKIKCTCFTRLQSYKRCQNSWTLPSRCD